LNKKLIKYIAIIVVVAFGLLITVSILTGYLRFVGVSKDSSNLQEGHDLVQAYQSAKTPEEKCKILNKVYGDDVAKCIEEELRLKL
jgi:hypothetical protein